MKKDTVIWSIVSLVALAIAVLIAAFVFGLDENTSPLVVTVLGLIAAIIPSLLALVKVDQVKTKMENGFLQEKMEAAINNTVTPHLLARPQNQTSDVEEGNGRPGV